MENDQPSVVGYLLCAVVPAALWLWVWLRRGHNLTSQEAVETTAIFTHVTSDAAMSWRRGLPLLATSVTAAFGIGLLNGNVPDPWFRILGTPLMILLFGPLLLMLTVFAFNWPKWVVAHRHRGELGYFAQRRRTRLEENDFDQGA